MVAGFKQQTRTPGGSTVSSSRCDPRNQHSLSVSCRRTLWLSRMCVHGMLSIYHMPSIVCVSMDTCFRSSMAYSCLPFYFREAFCCGDGVNVCHFSDLLTPGTEHADFGTPRPPSALFLRRTRLSAHLSCRYDSIYQ